MLVQEFELAFSQAKVEPKAVKISLTLWKALKSANLMKMRAVTAFGPFDLEFQMPFYKNTILLFDPELEFSDLSFQLPPNAT